MIGQKKLQSDIDRMIESGFPRFTIICGPKGSGKKLIAKSIGKKLQAHLIISGVKVDEIREIIDLAYTQNEPTLYLIPDTDKMSIASKNALLKITEEPPKKAYFIMTLNDLNNTLGTLKSRGNILHIDNYKLEDLIAYSDFKEYDFNSSKINVMNSICSVPGEVDLLAKYDIEEFNGYINTVLDNIGIVNGANAFKIGSKLAFKEEDSGWDIFLFMKGIIAECRRRMLESECERYKATIFITSKYISDLKMTGVNKLSTFDMWILEVRGLWMED